MNLTIRLFLRIMTVPIFLNINYKLFTRNLCDTENTTIKKCTPLRHTDVNKISQLAVVSLLARSTFGGREAYVKNYDGDIQAR